MAKNTPNPRREFIARCLRGTAVAISAMLALAGCGKKSRQEEEPSAVGRNVKSCDDLSAISEEDLATRTKLGYVTETPLPDNHCSNCNLYLPPVDGQRCGGCMLFKGPVFADAYCTYWAPKV